MLVDDQLFSKSTENKTDSTYSSVWQISIRQQEAFLNRKEHWIYLSNEERWGLSLSPGSLFSHLFVRIRRPPSFSSHLLITRYCARYYGVGVGGHSLPLRLSSGNLFARCKISWKDVTTHNTLMQIRFYMSQGGPGYQTWCTLFGMVQAKAKGRDIFTVKGSLGFLRLHSQITTPLEAENHTRVFSYRPGRQKPDVGFTGLKSECQQGRIFVTDVFRCQWPLVLFGMWPHPLSSEAIVFIPFSYFHISRLWLWLLLFPSYKDSCDSIWPSKIIQDNLSISRSLI